ncbi:hypothetical protein acsn021_19640 [Anaerocolumna cellulosilytica]|uniref:Uncharacterized protein n=1 Tax=Anaerocolumna cellulosilytica TaxID=433286 RepID=A0A6S6R4N3_9FIRM|nr:hypothetical protein [Anaerocolumna cellulosilytica]MBB5196483.1 hypothetical protein [Anaerocolumna cellulosilytica]BCJ94395.1 hypothetical protein acsn021_19640 [Anaerocolumna cellulosilytica]
MRGKKRKFLIGAIILFSLLIVYLISYKYLIVPYQIKELNDNMVIDGIPYKIGDKMDNLDLQILQKEDWEKDTMYEHFILYYSDNVGVIIFRGFPDYSNEYKFTVFRTKKHNINLFNIGIGSNASEAQMILKKKGYTEEDNSTYVKGKISISFQYDLERRIEEIEVELKSSDWFHKGYYK